MRARSVGPAGSPVQYVRYTRRPRVISASARVRRSGSRSTRAAAAAACERGASASPLGREQRAEHEVLRFAFHGVVARLVPFREQRTFESGAAIRIDQHRGEVGGRLVAGRTGDRPVRRQDLVRGEDLLRHHERVGNEVSQAPQVGRGIREPVDVVDAQSVDDAGVPQLGDQGVRRREDVGVLDADTRELRHVEEPPVVQERCAGTPRRELVVLTFERIREVGIGRADERECLFVVTSDAFLVLGDVRMERAGGDLVGDRRTEQRPEHAARVDLLVARGVDVEPARGIGPVAQERVPMRVASRGRLVVRHDVEEDAEPGLVNRIGEGFEAGPPSELGVDGRAVDDVVSVAASRTAP